MPKYSVRPKPLSRLLIRILSAKQLTESGLRAGKLPANTSSARLKHGHQMISLMLRLQAVRDKTYLLYRVLLREAIEADKWFGGVARRHGVAYTRVCDRDEWQAFKNRCIAQFGADKLEEIPLSSFDAAAAIGVEAYYDSHYRVYCQYTHGALEAVSGCLDELTDPEDTRVMLHSAMIALDALADMGAECSGIASFRERFNEVIRHRPDKLFRLKPTNEIPFSETPVADE